MLSKQDNEILCRVGPGTPMGDLMRQYWLPGADVERAADAGRPAAAPAPARREPHRLPDDLRRASASLPERLPAPRRLDVLRPQRRRGPALRLPRLEVRRRPAPASTCRPSPPRATSRTRSAPRPTRCTSATASSGPTWARATDAAAAAGPRAEHARRPGDRRPEGAARVQLDAGASKATSTRATSASCTSAASSRRTPRPARFDYYTVARPRAQVRRDRHRVRHLLRRLPARRGGHELLAHRPLPLPLLHDDPDGRARRAGARARLGADRRRAHDVLEHVGAATRSTARAPGGGSAARRQRRRPQRAPAAAGAAAPAASSTCPRPRLAGQVPPRPERGQRLHDRPRGAAHGRSYTGIPGIHQQDQAITESMGTIYDRTTSTSARPTRWSSARDAA